MASEDIEARRRTARSPNYFASTGPEGPCSLSEGVSPMLIASAASSSSIVRPTPASPQVKIVPVFLLAALDPSSASVQRDLSVSFIKVGDVLKEQGDLSWCVRMFATRSSELIDVGLHPEPTHSRTAR